jgi:hypothetical protein
MLDDLYFYIYTNETQQGLSPLKNVYMYSTCLKFCATGDR